MCAAKETQRRALNPVESPRVSVSEKLLLKDWEAAELLSVSIGTLNKLPIPRIKIEGTTSIRWKRADLDDYVKGLDRSKMSA
jgi:hypothetical protein